MLPHIDNADKRSGKKIGSSDHSGVFKAAQQATEVDYRTILHRRQFGIVDNLAPRTIWHHEQFGTTDNLAPGQFGTLVQKRTHWHRRQFGTTDNLAP